MRMYGRCEGEFACVHVCVLAGMCACLDGHICGHTWAFVRMWVRMGGLICAFACAFMCFLYVRFRVLAREPTNSDQGSGVRLGWVRPSSTPKDQSHLPSSVIILIHSRISTPATFIRHLPPLPSPGGVFPWSASRTPPAPRGRPPQAEDSEDVRFTRHRTTPSSPGDVGPLPQPLTP